MLQNVFQKKNNSVKSRIHCDRLDFLEEEHVKLIQNDSKQLEFNKY